MLLTCFILTNNRDRYVTCWLMILFWNKLQHLFINHIFCRMLLEISTGILGNRKTACYCSIIYFTSRFRHIHSLNMLIRINTTLFKSPKLVSNQGKILVNYHLNISCLIRQVASGFRISMVLKSCHLFLFFLVKIF